MCVCNAAAHNQKEKKKEKRSEIVDSLVQIEHQKLNSNSISQWARDYYIIFSSFGLEQQQQMFKIVKMYFNDMHVQ